MQTIEEILIEFMKHGFERTRIVYKRIGAKVCFFIYAIMCVCVCINVDILITVYLYVCRWKMKGKNIENKPIIKKTLC